MCLRCRRPGFSPWVRKIPWRRQWQPVAVFLPGESIPWTGEAGRPQSVESQRVGTQLSDLTHTHPRKRCFLFLAQLAPRRVRLELLLPPCPLQGRTVSGWRMKQAIGRSRGKMESWRGQLNACVEPCQKPAPSTGVQFSLGLFVRFLPSVPVVAWATVLIQCVSLSRRTFPSSNPTCVPFELSQCACPSLCFSWDVQPH